MKMLEWTAERFAAVSVPANQRVLSIPNDVDVAVAALDIADYEVVELSFPTFRDGRAFSQARALRERGFRGDIRATGGLFLDQYGCAVRCGFTSILGDELPTAEQATDAVWRFPVHYNRGGPHGVAWEVRA